MASVGAYYRLRGLHIEHAETFLRVGVVVGLVAALAAAFPTGDLQARLVADHQPVTFAAMEGHFESDDGAGLAMIGQPDIEKLKLDNPIVVPRVLSFLTHHRWMSFIPGLDVVSRATSGRTTSRFSTTRTT